MSETITWLHLSDRHIRPLNSWDAKRPVRQLIDDLRGLQARHHLRPDLVLFTGDLAFGQITSKGETLESEYAEGIGFLSRVCNAFDPPIPPEDVFLVPGNHDTNREVVTADHTAWLDEKATRDSIIEIIRDKDSRWQEYFARMDAYRAFVQRAGYTHILPDPDRLVYAVKRTLGGHTIGIAGFNSAWSCYGGKEKGRIWMGAAWQLETLANRLQDCDFKLALIHHPRGWLVDEEDSSFWRDLRERFAVCLHGHEHTAWVEQEARTNHILISAGACYDRSDKSNGYTLVHLVPEELRGQAWFRRYDSRGEGAWVPEIIANKTDDKGVWHLENLRWLRKPKFEPTPAPTVTVDEFKSKAVEFASEHAAVAIPTGAAPQIPSTPASETGAAIAGAAGRIEPAIPADDAGGSGIGRVVKATLAKLDVLIKKGSFTEADLLLKRCIEENSGRLSAREMFRLTVQEGEIHFERGDRAAAADAYRRAAGHLDAAEPQARYFAALGDELGGREADAHGSYTLLKEEHPGYETAAVLSGWIRTAPSEMSPAQIESQLTEEQCQSPEVAFTLSGHGSRASDYAFAEKYGRIAQSARPDWVDACDQLGVTLLQKEFGPRVSAGYIRPVARPNPTTIEAERLLKHALECLKDVSSEWRKAAICTNLGVLYTATGRVVEATRYYAQAHKHEPHNAEIVVQYVLSLDRAGKSGEAIDQLRSWLKTHQSTRATLLFANFLAASHAPELNQANAAEVVTILDGIAANVAQMSREERADWVCLHVQVQLAAGEAKSARTWFDGLDISILPAAERGFVDALICRANGDLAAATERARAAAANAENSPPSVIRNIAQLLEQLGDRRMALPLWKRVCTFTALGLEESHYINCAQHLEEREAVVEACRKLRGNGVRRSAIVLAELGALEIMSPERLIERLRELLDEPVSRRLKPELRALLSSKAIQLGKQEFIDTDPRHLPAAASVRSARVGRLVVEVLRSNPNRMLPVEYAYELIRRFPDDLDAHIAMLYSVGLNGTPVEVPTPQVVAVGTAVRYEDQESRQDEWWIIEDSPRPSISRRERKPADPLSQRLAGKAVGDTVVLRDRPAPAKIATVKEIISKYVYRWRTCADNLETSFPGQNVLWKIQAKDENAIEVLRKQFQDREDHVKKVNGVYASHPVPLFMLANAFGASICEALQHVISTPELEVRCCDGNRQERRAAMAAWVRCKKVVIDASSLATLYALRVAGIYKPGQVLRALDRHCIISEHVLADARMLLEHMPQSGLMKIGTHAGRLFRYDITTDQAQSARETLRDFLTEIQSVCEIAKGSQPSAEEAPWYKQYLDVFGQGTAESIRLSSEEDAILWSDELVVHLVCRSQIADRRIWTPLLMDAVLAEKKPQSQKAALATLYLYQAGYSFVGVPFKVLMVAVEKSEWLPSKPPLRAALKQFADPRVLPQDLIRTGAEFLNRLWLETDQSREQKRAKKITDHTLTRMSNRPDGAYLVWKVVDAMEGLRRINREKARNWRHAAAQWLGRKKWAPVDLR